MAAVRRVSGTETVCIGCRYEIMSPETIGLSREATDVGVVLGKHSGRNALRTRLAAMGYTLEADALNEVRPLCVLSRSSALPGCLVSEAATRTQALCCTSVPLQLLRCVICQAFVTTQCDGGRGHTSCCCV